LGTGAANGTGPKKKAPIPLTDMGGGWRPRGLGVVVDYKRERKRLVEKNKRDGRPSMKRAAPIET